MWSARPSPRSEATPTRSLLEASRVHYVGAEELRAVDPELRSLRNLNTPQEYQAWLESVS